MFLLKKRFDALYDASLQYRDTFNESDQVARFLPAASKKTQEPPSCSADRMTTKVGMGG